MRIEHRRLRRRMPGSGVGFALAAVLALAGPAVGSARAAGPPHTVLHLSETAERNVERDRLRIEMRAEESGADPAVVQAAINRRMAAALEQARRSRGFIVETGVYRVGEERAKHGPVLWRGSQSLILTGKDAGAVLKLAGTLQADGLAMSSLGYTVSPEAVRGAEEDLTNEALAALGRRAAAIAERLHLKVSRYRDLKIGNAESGPAPHFAAALAMPRPVAAPGEGTVRVTITADLILVPAAAAEAK